MLESSDDPVRTFYIVNIVTLFVDSQSDSRAIHM